MTPSLEGGPAKANKAPSPHEVRLTLLGTNLLFQCFRVKEDVYFESSDEEERKRKKKQKHQIK